ncbi:hypothetical protein I6H46_03115 [Anaerococcus obesiensis]|uniref:Uncharacterized protein n=3 Tax=Anaerococcus TaxID=165779 RepID=C7HWF5_9FIRM|nr:MULTISPECIES: hypothetical protein [Anaerococcus]EEU11912.1 hypothetical protein HMPREF0078_1606 [Anaerococcus vaginalis ATCC 51170]MDU0944808.1 hypothetical protein [Anaerococcus vaginalis]MDU1029813.1 hypothetical protein [Anaerococcus vaginalis]MDU5460534.1 hypothetical protein [Anaerococcus vaginalis]QQB61933.1 hypothetical protein I6H45_00095 [Anaerococcus vaginalis]
MKRQVEVPIFILGIVIWVVAIFLPVDSLEFILGNGLRPLGLATIFICPILGIIGMLFSIKNRNIILSFLNIFLILAFPITMSIGYYF